MVTAKNAVQNRTEKIASQILLYKDLYYSGRAAITDEAYDALEEELRRLDPTHPALTFVGYKIRESASKVAHKPPMLSLAKSYEQADLISFADGRAVIVSDKVDGMAISLEYDLKGQIFRASTRGNGQLGEDVTAHAMHVLSLPKQLNSSVVSHKCRFEIRGEMYFPIAEFTAFSERFDSYRNAVPGTFGRKEIDEAVDVLNVLKFRAYDIIAFPADTENPLGAKEMSEIFGRTYFEKLSWLEANGFETGIREKTTQLISTDMLNSHLADTVMAMFRAERDHQIDGIVLRLNDEILFEALGTTSHHPRGSLAFKQEGEVAITEILAIETSIGRSGKMTFRAQVKPVQLSGALISYATLHNADFVRSGGYAPGALVRITRSGEVIPSIVGLERAAPSEYRFPVNCPCGFPLEATGPDLYCSQSISCAPKDQESFLYFAQTLEIVGLSEKTVSKLREANLLKSPADFFRLSVEDVLRLEGFAQRSAENLVASIQAKKQIPLALFLASLGLKRGGLVKCREVAARFGTLEKVRLAAADELAQERGWAEKSALDFVESLRAKEKWIDDLLQFVVVLEDTSRKERERHADHILAGKNVCITGSLSMPREVYVRRLEQVGAKVASSVTAKTHFLVCNEESSSSKFVQAKKLGIPVIKEAELVEMLGNV